jgi:ABC-type molybdenum transport system ATPase subunit/photorepair protein PhrA
MTTRKDTYRNGAGSTTLWRAADGSLVTQSSDSSVVTVRIAGSHIEVPKTHLGWLAHTLREAADVEDARRMEAV